VKIVQLPLGGGRILDPRVSVIPITNGVERMTTVSMLRAALGDDVGGNAAEGVTVDINRITLGLSPEVKGLIVESRRSRPVVFDVGDLDVEKGSEEAPELTTLRSAIALDAALATPDQTPPAISPVARRRLDQLVGLGSRGRSQSSEFDDAIEQLAAWRSSLLAGYKAIEDKDAEVQAADAAASKKLAGPSAFNRFVDLRDERDSLVQQVGFADYETYRRERSNVLKAADERMMQLRDAADEASGGGIGVTAEIQILELHRGIADRLGGRNSYGIDGDTPRNRHMLRHNLSTAVSQVLASLGIAAQPTNAVATAQAWLDKTSGASIEARLRRTDELALHLAVLAGASDIGPMPAVVIGAGVLFSADGLREKTLDILRQVVRLDQQVIFVEPAGSATQLQHVLAELIDRVAVA
jgi:hypothetical protein